MTGDWKGLAPLLVIGAMTAHASHLRLDPLAVTNPTRDAAGTLPSIDALRLLSLGYETLIADYYWLRALSHFGDERNDAYGYPEVIPLIRRVLALDPLFLQAYTFAGTALTLNVFDPHDAVELLEEGVRRRPDVWRLPFLLGFNRYYFLGDFAGAAQALASAARLPGAPGEIAALAARVAAHAGRPEVGLSLVDSMLDNLEDDSLRPLYEERRKLLLLEMEIHWLEQAVRRFTEREGRPPDSLQELVRVGTLPETPRDPFGEPYKLNDDGSISSATKRLRLERDALPTPPPPRAQEQP